MWIILLYKMLIKNLCMHLIRFPNINILYNYSIVIKVRSSILITTILSALQTVLLLFSCESCLTLCDPMVCSIPGFPVLHHLSEFAQTHVHWVGNAIQLSCPLSPSPSAFNLSQHQGLFQWVGSSHQGARALELQLQHWSFQ